MIELKNVTLLGPIEFLDSKLTKFVIIVSHEQLLSLNEAGYERVANMRINCFGAPSVHDDLPNSWNSSFGKYVRGDALIEIKPFVYRGIERKIVAIHAVRVTYRPTWDEYKAELMGRDHR